MKIRLCVIASFLLIIAGLTILRHSTFFEQQYPRSVKFAAPHLSTMGSIIDRLWFSGKPPWILHSIIPVVYAQSCIGEQYPQCQAAAGSSCDNGCTPWVCKLQNKYSTCTNNYGLHPCEICPNCNIPL
jgi:hypothetical protein